jgi:hypothetical protein
VYLVPKSMNVTTCYSPYNLYTDTQILKEYRHLSSRPSRYGSGYPMSNTGLGEKKHIHFNEQVEQYVALETIGDDEESDSYAIRDNDDSDSDDGASMIKMTKSMKKLSSTRATPQASVGGDSKQRK